MLAGSTLQPQHEGPAPAQLQDRSAANVYARSGGARHPVPHGFSQVVKWKKHSAVFQLGKHIQALHGLLPLSTLHFTSSTHPKTHLIGRRCYLEYVSYYLFSKSKHIYHSALNLQMDDTMMYFSKLTFSFLFQNFLFLCHLS
jgi:hypothetical protein